MTNLTTEIKTHIVIFKNQDTKPMYVDSMTAKRLSAFRSDPNSVNFPIVNFKTGELIKDIGKYEIVTIEEISKESKSDGSAKWICDYGHEHRMHEKCACKMTYGVHWLDLLRYCQERFGVNFVHQIKPHMTNDFLRVHSLSK